MNKETLGYLLLLLLLAVASIVSFYELSGNGESLPF